METDTVDSTVTGNTFENMSRGLIFNLGGIDKIPPGYRIYGNTVKQPACQNGGAAQSSSR